MTKNGEGSLTKKGKIQQSKFVILNYYLRSQSYQIHFIDSEKS